VLIGGNLRVTSSSFSSPNDITSSSKSNHSYHDTSHDQSNSNSTKTVGFGRASLRLRRTGSIIQEGHYLQILSIKSFGNQSVDSSLVSWNTQIKFGSQENICFSSFVQLHVVGIAMHKTISGKILVRDSREHSDSIGSNIKGRSIGRGMNKSDQNISSCGKSVFILEHPSFPSGIVCLILKSNE